MTHDVECGAAGNKGTHQRKMPLVSRKPCAMNRAEFTGWCFVQISGYFIKNAYVCTEDLLSSASVWCASYITPQISLPKANLFCAKGSAATLAGLKDHNKRKRPRHAHTKTRNIVHP